MAWWDYSQWNEIVKQVENCSVTLRYTRGRILEQTPVRGYHQTTARLLGKLNKIIRALDDEALHMIALYDGAAQSMIRQHRKIDVRRGLSEIEPLARTLKRPAKKPTPKRAPAKKKSV